MAEKVNKEEYSSKDVVLVSGRLDMSEQYFQSFIAPHLDKAMAAKAFIHVGSGSGCDTWTRKYCVSKCYEKLHVFVPKKHTRQVPDDAADNLYFLTFADGGFKARDIQMRKDCTCIIVSFSQYEAAGSGAFANFLAVAFGVEDSYDVMETVRKVSFAPNEQARKQVLAIEDPDARVQQQQNNISKRKK